MSKVQHSVEIGKAQGAIGEKDFLDIIRTYVSLDENTETPCGYCPICHGDGRTFQVHPVSREWNCRGCGKSGDIYDFIGYLRRVSREEAVRFVTILSRRSSTEFSYSEKRNGSKAPEFVRRSNPTEKVVAAPMKDANDPIPAVDNNKKASAENHKTKTAAVRIELVSQNPPSPPKAKKAGVVSEKRSRGNTSTVADSLPIPDTVGTDNKGLVTEVKPQLTQVAEPVPKNAAPGDEPPQNTTPASDFPQGLLEIFDSKSDVMGLALIARDEGQDVICSTIPELMACDVQLLNTFAQDALRYSMRIVGEFDASQNDIVFSMNTTFKAAETKLMWIPVDRKPFHCNVLFMLKDNARESILSMQLRKFFQ